jgi:RNA polymerase sigma-70 factor (ECF subfamily)
VAISAIVTLLARGAMADFFFAIDLLPVDSCYCLTRAFLPSFPSSMDDRRESQTPSCKNSRSAFPATRWSIIVGLVEGSEESRKKALEELCQAYWFPLYAFARHQGNSSHQAEDLTQGFFAYLLSNERFLYLQNARGRLRNYLLAAMKQYLVAEWRSTSAKKRGGDREIVSLDIQQADGRYLEIASKDASPEEIFHQQWVLSLLEKARTRVAAQYAGGEKAKLFKCIEAATTDPEAIDYAEASAELNMSSGALRTAVHRLRKRFGEAIREEIAETVANSDEAEAEYQDLLEHG